MDFLLEYGRFAIPVVLFIGIILISLSAVSNSKRKRKSVDDSALADLNDIATRLSESEIGDLLESEDTKDSKVKAQLSGWWRFWLNSYEKAGVDVNEGIEIDPMPVGANMAEREAYYKEVTGIKKKKYMYYGNFVFAVMVFGAVVGFVMFKLIGLVIGIAAIPALLYTLNTNKAMSRSIMIDSQLLGFSQAMIQNLTAGKIPQNAFIDAVEDISDPLRSELEDVKADVLAGMPFTDALTVLAEKYDSREIKFFASAMSVSVDRGADLIPQLKIIGDKLSKRKQLREKIAEAVSSQSTLIKLVAVVVPGAMLLSSSGLLSGGNENPNALPASEVWSTPAGIGTLVVIVVLWIAGIILVRHKVNQAKKI